MRFGKKFTPLPPDIQRIIIDAYAEGRSFLSIRTELGISDYRIRRCLTMAGIKIRVQGRPPAQQPAKACIVR